MAPEKTHWSVLFNGGSISLDIPGVTGRTLSNTDYITSACVCKREECVFVCVCVCEHTKREREWKRERERAPWATKWVLACGKISAQLVSGLRRTLRLKNLTGFFEQYSATHWVCWRNCSVYLKKNSFARLRDESRQSVGRQFWWLMLREEMLEKYHSLQIFQL